MEDCNLSVGYENLIQKSEGPEPIHSLLDALIHLNETKGDEVKADIVSLHESVIFFLISMSPGTILYF